MDDSSPVAVDVAQAEGKLKRELGLRDVTLFAIACIVGVRWVPSAAHAGPGSVMLWLIAALFFVMPLAAAVGTLSVKYPGSGGLYYWTRNDFGPWNGFLCFWIYWLGLAFWFPTAAMFYTSVGVYTLGPGFAHLADNRAFLILASLVAIWIALYTNLIGMRIGKWTENLGGFATWTLLALFIAMAAIVWAKRGPATHLNIVPKWNRDTLNLGAATIAYAMTGFELVALMGAEIREPARTLPRAGWIASGFAAAFYAVMTVALLVVLAPSAIDERYGFAQGADAAARLTGALWLTPLIALLVLLTGMGQFGGIGSSVSRLPFAVGVDRMLPAAFARVHPKWHTPHISILLLGGVASFLLVVFQLGDTLRAAYDTLVSLMVIAGFIPYIYIFGSAWKASRQLSAVCGWSVTAIALVSSIVPTGEIHNVWLFESKLALGTAAMVASAWLLYRRARA
ncbi:MAG TPA: APC family permease [Bryobacteraceae bacterium]|nr:APC family permease [Bryobacteraceae bacterium]